MKRQSWTTEKILKEALKYKTRTDFMIGSRGAHKAAKRLGIFNQACAHMESVYEYWNLEKLQKEVLRYTTRAEFQKGSSGAYDYALRHKLLELVCSNMKLTYTYWTLEMLQKEALTYETRDDFAKNSPNAYMSATRKNVIDQICSHMTAVRKTWTPENLKLEALLYTSRVSFQKGSGSAYLSALNTDILDEICAHMEYICYPWTDEELAEEALLYNTRSDFAKNSSAYSVASDRGILNSICTHMKLSTNTSSPERSLLNAIKESFPEASKLWDRQIKINGKSHIKGFELDIYIPELNMAIEHDGNYWHSYEGLKRSRPHWPDEDVRNYHQIKDEWFSSKGIAILHVNGDFWLENPKACLKKCLDFLNNKESKVA
jgi:hypothetical protein